MMQPDKVAVASCLRELLIKSILSFPRPRHTRDSASRRARRESMRNKVLDPRLSGDDELISASLATGGKTKRKHRFKDIS